MLVILPFFSTTRDLQVTLRRLVQPDRSVAIRHLIPPLFGYVDLTEELVDSIRTPLVFAL